MSDIEFKTTKEDLAKIIACETSGLKDRIPEEEDFALADLFIEMINHDARFWVARKRFKADILNCMRHSIQIESGNLY